MEKAQITFGKRLRFIRKERKLTLEALGKLASIGYKHIADIERGVKVPSFDAIDRLAAALRIEPHHFFVGEGPSEAIVNRELRKLFEILEQHCEMKTKVSVISLLTILTEKIPQ